ncbi:MAG TPA: hypothetical protein ENG47_04980 [Candidatus Aerophobetes bacterium]|uniref:F0F1 ATP synthase subunit gamma n=1 Tax=Aerophobetes bacterium TaxID=2030807 RepID=A0A7V0N1S3_UNCAE|nr:hypothetical protein [Candidatus Aerophobetes bacterium]
MIPAAKLKERIGFYDNLGNIINVLKISTSMQLRHFQAKIPTDKVFLEELKNSMALINVKNAPHPLLIFKPDLPCCIVGITSDEGFLGELNTLVVNALLDTRKSLERDQLVILGERGADYLRDLGLKFKAFKAISDDFKQDEIERLKNYLISGYLEDKFGEVVMVYPQFISVTTYKVKTTRLLPFVFEDSQGETIPDSLGEEFLIEPSPVEIVGGLIKLWLSFVLSDIFWSSKLSEFAARLMHLDSSEQRLKKVNRRLRLEYFRFMHILSDRTIREVSASRFVRKRYEKRS